MPVPYGETWECERCRRNYRLVVIGIALGLIAVLGTLALLVDVNLVLLLPVVLASWFMWFMPWSRRRLRRRTRSLPTWQLTPEEPSGTV
jgi:hypothetical protein